jgi:hypothetical protein
LKLKGNFEKPVSHFIGSRVVQNQALSRYESTEFNVYSPHPGEALRGDGVRALGGGGGAAVRARLCVVYVTPESKKLKTQGITRVRSSLLTLS